MYVAFYNLGRKAERGTVTVPDATFGRLLIGDTGECGMERGELYAVVPPRTLLLFSVMQTPVPGLYRKNIHVTTTGGGRTILHMEEDGFCAVYKMNTENMPELIALLRNGDSADLPKGATYKLLYWNELLQPVCSE